MIFSWLKQRRRQRILADPFPIQWLDYFRGNLPWYPLLDESNRIRLRRDVQVFVAEKNWEGCGGLQMTEEIKVTIAAQACLLVLELEEGLFDRVLSVLVYPGGYHSREAHLHEGWLIEEENDLLGQAHYRGPVILSWKDVSADSRHWGGGKNLVWHEFAHQLDALDREWNGTPPLSSVQQCRKWRDVMTAEYERLIADAEAGRITLLDPYGSLNEAEFFAVSTECFFDRPVALRQQHPPLYQLLSEYYRQDPALRMDRSSPNQFPE